MPIPPLSFNPSSVNVFPPNRIFIPSTQNTDFIPCTPEQKAQALEQERALRMSPQEYYKTYCSDLTYEEFLADDKTKYKLLYNRGRLDLIAKYSFKPLIANTYNMVKENKDFQELIKSKYLNDENGFLRTLDNLGQLMLQREEKCKPLPPEYHFSDYIPRGIDYSKYDMNDYLKMLNNFSKNPKISDGLKKYFLYIQANKLDLYYTKLDKLNTAQNPMDVLLEKLPYNAQE